jgi:hypothetical protein
MADVTMQRRSSMWMRDGIPTALFDPADDSQSACEGLCLFRPGLAQRKSACLTQDIDAQNTVNPRF